MAPDWVVKALDEGEHRHPRLSLGAEAAAVEQLALEGGEEGLGHGVVIGVTDRAGGGADARFFASEATDQRRISLRFNRPSQHHPDLLAARCREPRQASSSPASCVASR